ncbi:hypothetical protein D9M71_635930 [compost metagenome]
MIVQRSFGRLALVDLAPHVGVPGHGDQQQQAGADHDLIEHPLILAPGVLRGGRIAAPATVDDAQLLRRDAQQCLVEDVIEFLGLAPRCQGERRLLGAYGGADLQLGFEQLRGDEVVGDHQ